MAKRIDYDRMEPDWRAGIKSPQQIADEYKEAIGQSVSRQAICKYFKKNSIPRDLSEKIRAKAKEKVAADGCTNGCTQSSATENEIVEANATGIADVQLTQRKDVKKSRSLLMRLWEELESQMDYTPELEKLGEIMLNPETSGDRLSTIYRKVIEFPSRVDGVKKLSDALKTLIALERQAYNITDDTGVEEYKNMTLEELVAKRREVARKILG